MKARKKFSSISQVLQQVAQLENKCRRINYLLGYQSSDIIKVHKQFLILSNSLAIVFMQYDLTHISLDLLKKAAEIDVDLYKRGGLEDRLWEGRLLTYNNLAWLFQRYLLYRESH
jgi:hypothetical protein